MLTENQKKALDMIHDYYPINEVAAACGVHRTTIWRWQQTRDFRREWQRIERNARRRYDRWLVKWDRKKEIEREQRAAAAEAKLNQKLAEIESKTGKSHQKAVRQAWNEYINDIFEGRSWAEVSACLNGDKPIRRRRRRRT